MFSPFIPYSHRGHHTAIDLPTPLTRPAKSSWYLLHGTSLTLFRDGFTLGNEHRLCHARIDSEAQ
jgi:hypothetical protein